ncbi:hypothetical protein [Actinomadura coerulea]|uniref:hypothetical protein n=1 Tax=Actinomadura coerulea TaxID=46159 RepID=UPI0034359353
MQRFDPGDQPAAASRTVSLRWSTSSVKIRSVVVTGIETTRRVVLAAEETGAAAVADPPHRGDALADGVDHTDDRCLPLAFDQLEPARPLTVTAR